MDARAYVLIEAEAGTAAGLLAQLRRLPGVSRADAVTGPYDLIAVIDAADERAIGALVMQHLHPLPGVIRTITCLAIAH
jgi:DNA-binding Lrp family transcriptional regulator